jgi:hydroxymethylpyrimidine kinase/phosphomethylpyrimidine kinase
MRPPRVLTIAGSDPSGGAGLQADLKTFHAHGCYGMAVVTALTAQNTVGVRGVHAPPASFVDEQIAAVVEDCGPVATKTGMLFSSAIIEVVARWAERGALGRLVVDPVMVATSGDRLLRSDAEAALRERLLPFAEVVTPNRPEAAVLLETRESDIGDVVNAAAAVTERFGVSALVKGGHVAGDSVRDALSLSGGESDRWVRPRVDVAEAHGTGCTLSAAIAARLARGQTLVAAVAGAGDYVHRALRSAYPVGAGAVPVDHGVDAS